MKVGLLIPDYIDRRYPDVAIAMQELEKLGLDYITQLNKSAVGAYSARSLTIFILAKSA